MISYLYVFTLGFCVDVLWVRLIQNVHKSKPVTAAFQSVLLATPGLFGFVEVSRDLALAPAYLAGLWLGMYVAINLTRGGDSDEVAEDDTEAD